MPGRSSWSALLPTGSCKHLKGKYSEGYKFLTGVLGCSTGKHEVSQKDCRKCPGVEQGSSPAGRAGLQEEGEGSPFLKTEEEEEACGYMMRCVR